MRINMGYIKCGIVTRIDIVSGDGDCLGDFFDLSLYKRVGDGYFICDDILQDNLVSYREEFLKFSFYHGDSFDSSDAYCIGTSINELLRNKIYLIRDNSYYYFDNHLDYLLDADVCFFKFNDTLFRFFVIPVFWDVNRVDSECFDFISITVNNLTRGAMKNVLKDASWFYVI